MTAQYLVAAIGLWMMAAPAVLGYAGIAEAVARTAGPIITTLAVIAMSECTRGVRLANIPIGLFLMSAPLLIEQPPDAAVNGVAAGAAVVLLSRVRGQVRSRFAGGWQSLWHNTTGGHNV
jgi:hypothetical protein